MFLSLFYETPYNWAGADTSHRTKFDYQRVTIPVWGWSRIEGRLNGWHTSELLQIR